MTSALSTLPRRISYWREFSGLTRAKMASGLGLSTEAIRAWEKGVSPPTLENLANAVDLLGVTFAEFWGPIPTASSTKKRGSL